MENATIILLNLVEDTTYHFTYNETKYLVTNSAAILDIADYYNICRIDGTKKYVLVKPCDDGTIKIEPLRLDDEFLTECDIEIEKVDDMSLYEFLSDLFANLAKHIQ